jgi:hypothetical protein
MNEHVCCPKCGADPTDDSVVTKDLSHLGYAHEDTRLDCQHCSNTWQIGEPLGDCDDDTWVCDACDGDLMPHFVYVYDDGTVNVKPKCQQCYWVPDNPLVFEGSEASGTVRWFVGHHTTTGNRDEAELNEL